MREILFKAKRIDNGEWVEGYFTSFIDEDIIFTGLYEEKIDRKTLCEFTGLTDNNGVKIFECDIIKHEIVFNAELITIAEIIEWFDGGWVLKGKAKNRIGGDAVSRLSGARKIEVIGSIHDKENNNGL